MSDYNSLCKQTLWDSCIVTCTTSTHCAACYSVCFGTHVLC